MTTILRPIRGRQGQYAQWRQRAGLGSDRGQAVGLWRWQSVRRIEHNAYIGNTGVRAWFKRMFNPDTTNSLQVYDPATNSWTSGPTLNQQRSFPAGTHVGNTAVAVGGYTGTGTTASVEINVAGGGCVSPTPTIPPTATPTASPSCTPGGSPGPWSTASPYPIPDVRYGFAQTATHFYVFGGVSNGTRVPNVNRWTLPPECGNPARRCPSAVKRLRVR